MERIKTVGMRGCSGAPGESLGQGAISSAILDLVISMAKVAVFLARNSVDAVSIQLVALPQIWEFWILLALTLHIWAISRSYQCHPLKGI